MSEPVVTVVIPCHNHIAWVNDAVNSVVGQSHPAKRIVLVDDGSTDGSALSVVGRLDDVSQVRQDEPLTWTGSIQGVPVMVASFKQARGPAFARNCGIKCGWDGTDVFMFLDSDDVYLPGKMEKSVAKWADAPDHVGAVYTDYETFNPESGITVREYKEAYSLGRLMNECLPNMDSLVSKLALEQCGTFDHELRTCEDYDLWLRIAAKFIIVHVPEALLRLRVGGHSSTATVPTEVWVENRKKVLTKAHARMSNAA